MTRFSTSARTAAGPGRSTDKAGHLRKPDRQPEMGLDGMLRMKAHIGADAHSLMNGVSHGNRCLRIAQRKPDPVDLYGHRPRLSGRQDPDRRRPGGTGHRRPAGGLAVRACRVQRPARGERLRVRPIHLLRRHPGRTYLLQRLRGRRPEVRDPGNRRRGHGRRLEPRPCPARGARVRLRRRNARRRPHQHADPRRRPGCRQERPGDRAGSGLAGHLAGPSRSPSWRPRPRW